MNKNTKKSSKNTNKTPKNTTIKMTDSKGKIYNLETSTDISAFMKMSESG
jgi:hypothetical protein